MSKNHWSDLIELLDNANVAFDAGLTDAEIARAETEYEFHFPIDLREFLQTAMPRGYPSFPDWRSGDEDWIRDLLRGPLSGVLFDVEHNWFWLPEWGARPTHIEEALSIAGKHVNQAPRLIPIYGHRYMPDRPHDSGNPVLSVNQTDIIYYGFDLDDYLRHEFCLPNRKLWPSQVRTIEFWDVDRWQNLNYRPNESI